MHREAVLLLFAMTLTAATPVVAGVESHDQYRRHGPTRYVVSVWEVIHDQGIVKTQKRTFKWKQRAGSMSRTAFARNERSVLPGEWYGPIRVDKSIDHLSWSGSYWRDDGAFEANLYEVEVEELRPVGPIMSETYEVEVRIRLVKRAPLFQPNLTTP